MGKRLFVGISLNESVKNKIFNIEKEVKNLSLNSVITPMENLHITLLFLGNTEIENEEIVKKIITAVAKKFNSFLAMAFCLDTFKKDSITYLKVKPNKMLDKLFRELYIECRQNGIELNLPNEKYLPHITLARKTKYTNVSDLLNIKTDEILIDVNNITLFHSHRIDEKLIYEPIKICNLGK